MVTGHSAPGEMRSTHNIPEGKFEEKRTSGRPRQRRK
jgi:hypothetical protein